MIINNFILFIHTNENMGQKTFSLKALKLYCASINFSRTKIINGMFNDCIMLEAEGAGKKQNA